MNDTNLPGSHDNLTVTQFENLLRRLHPDRDQAGAKYEDMRLQLTKFFEWSCDFPADDLVDETLDRVARRLQDLEVADVSAFAWGVARNVRLEASRKAARMIPLSEEPGDEGWLPAGGNVEAAIHEKMEFDLRRKQLQTCLQRLSQEDRELFLAYYRYEGDAVACRQKLANRLGLTMNALRVRVNRLRDKIERYTNAPGPAPARRGPTYFIKKNSA